MAVAPDGNHAEGHFAQAAARVAKGQREIAVDAVPHRIAFGAHAQRLGDGEFAVLGDLDVRIKGMDDFGGRRFARKVSAAIRAAMRQSLFMTAMD